MTTRCPDLFHRGLKPRDRFLVAKIQLTEVFRADSTVVKICIGTIFGPNRCEFVVIKSPNDAEFGVVTGLLEGFGHE